MYLMEVIAISNFDPKDRPKILKVLRKQYQPFDTHFVARSLKLIELDVIHKYGFGDSFHAELLQNFINAGIKPFEISFRKIDLDACCEIDSDDWDNFIENNFYKEKIQ